MSDLGMDMIDIATELSEEVDDCEIAIVCSRCEGFCTYEPVISDGKVMLLIDHVCE